MRFLFLLLLAGCSANQGAFPVAPPFTPSMDAPIVVGQPGYVGEPERAPRSPHKRVLPETPETMRQPGIWAATDPFTPTILDVEVPPTPDVSDVTRAAEHRCVADYADVFFRSEELARRAFRHSPAQRRCIAAALFAECMGNEARKSPTDEVRRIAKAALDRETRDCAGHYGEVVNFVNEVERSKSLPGPSGDAQ